MHMPSLAGPFYPLSQSLNVSFSYACHAAMDTLLKSVSDAASKQVSEARKAERQENKELKRELRRKEAAVAETAALLTLRKKARAIWGDEDE